MDTKMINKDLTVRLRGGDGGWRGDASYIGVVRLEDGATPQLHIVKGLTALTQKASLPVLAAKDAGHGFFAVEIPNGDGGRWLHFETHRQHHASLGIGAAAPAPIPKPAVTLNPNQKFRARLTGQGSGGWKGDPKFVGVVRFSPPSLPTKMEQLSFEAGFEGHPAAGKSFEVEEISAVTDGRFEVLLNQFPCLDENDDGEEVIVHRAEELTFEIHREDVAKATIVSCSPNEAAAFVTQGLSDFAHEKPEPEVPEAQVAYQPGESEKAKVAFYEAILNDQSALGAREHTRAVALAMLRHAVQNPGVSVALDTQAPSRHLMARSVVLNDRILRNTIMSFSKAAGLLQFMQLERDFFSVCPKEKAKDPYAYAKAIEPFIVPVDQMQLALPAKEYAPEAPLQMNEVMKEALELTRRVNKG